MAARHIYDKHVFHSHLHSCKYKPTSG